MKNSKWFEEKPSKDFQERVERAADRAIDRRCLFSFFSSDIVGAFSVAALASFAGLWLLKREEALPVELADAELEVEDIELLADLDFLQEFETIEFLKDEDLSS